MRRYLTLLGLLAALGGCAAMADPFQRPDTYVATGVNDDNLRAMIANPVDLQHGVAAPDTVGLNAAAAVARLRNDNVRQLPSSTLSDIGGGAGTGGQSTGGATGATGGAQ
jgi:hypothetical protein